MKEATASSFLPSFCPSTLSPSSSLSLSLSLVFFQGESFPPQGDAISYGISYGCQRIELSRGRECCLSSKMFPRVIPFSKCNRYKSRLTARFEQIWFDYVEEYFEFGILEYRSNIADIVILDSPVTIWKFLSFNPFREEVSKDIVPRFTRNRFSAALNGTQ